MIQVAYLVLRLENWLYLALRVRILESTFWMVGRMYQIPHSEFFLLSFCSFHSFSTRFLYSRILCMDANFRLKNQLVSNYSQDPGLGIGLAYFVECGPYEKYVLSQTDADEVGLPATSFLLADIQARLAPVLALPH